MERLGLALMAVVGLLASSIQAAPLHYKIDLVATPQAPGYLLANAQLQLNLTWDAAATAPIASSPSGTFWPINTNTVASLTVSGSAAADGTYAASFVPSPSLTWIIDNDSPGLGDALHFPVMRFQIGGQTVESSILLPHFASTFFDGQHPFYPKPFDFEDATWPSMRFVTQGVGAILATVVDASAVAVPEPTTCTLAVSSLVALAVLRRRK
ncbi:hypothetical protein [Lacipirellula parvula]|uniref:PEP-CTERM protein-sorting domain-containing protein n=1 Tax=Lacipirellula parvula TaxID=2650471 RepID=A0A5K7XD64_9BACT|nr:hypothetical protein [Lacipirellula parvula]BBO34750.1 hypothetical protein PLANPX_4362 [Lacipirellula parvula]